MRLNWPKLVESGSRLGRLCARTRVRSTFVASVCFAALAVVIESRAQNMAPMPIAPSAFGGTTEFTPGSDGPYVAQLPPANFAPLVEPPPTRQGPARLPAMAQPAPPAAPGYAPSAPRSPLYGPEQPTSPQPRVASERYVVDRVEAENVLELVVGRPILLRFAAPPFRDQVADTQIADAINVDETQYSIVGNSQGTTTLNFWFRNPDAPGGEEVLSYMVRVFDDPDRNRRLEAMLAALEAEINRTFPDSAVRLSYVGSQVVIRGEARDVEEATQILSIVSRSLPDQDDADQVPPGDLLLGGVGPDAIEQAGGLSGLLQGQNQSGVNAARINSRIVNLLEVAGVQQVMLKVTVAEVNRSAIRAIGAEMNLSGESVGFMSLLPSVDIGVPSSGGNFTINRGDFDLAINALKTLNLARSLAEPNLVTLNGQSADFQVGGQFPVPQITGFTDAGLQGVEFVPFGVQLNFLPVITDRDRVRLQLQATVSTRDESLGTNIGGSGGGGGSQVPGLNSRNFRTTVELRSGETLAIAGLIQNNYGGQSSRVPFLGDVPVLGRIFASDGFTYDEQELIVLVTPVLASPLAPGVQCPLPGSDLYEPSDFEYFVLGRIEGRYAEDFRTPARTDIGKAASYRHLEQCYIIGQPGHSDGKLCPR